MAVINNAYKQNINSETNVADLDEDSDGVDDFDEEEMDILDASNKPPIIRTVNNIILQAIKQRVSDIHLQPYEEKLQVRYRIDGILYDVQSVPKNTKMRLSVVLKLWDEWILQKTIASRWT